MTTESRPSRPSQRLAALAAYALLTLGGCATGPNPVDPLEPWNRGVYRFNEHVDAALLKPAATLYRDRVPALARTGVSNFFGNLSDGWSAVNSLLQLKLQNAAEDWMRFSFNSAFGFAGILDIASEMNIERHRQDLGKTLGRWGVPPGPYVVLPVLGPTTLRDTVTLPIGWRGDPLYYLTSSGERDSLYGLRLLDARTNLLRMGDVLEAAALDRYSFTRDAYLQMRRAEVLDGNPQRGAASDGDDGGDASATEPSAAPHEGTRPQR